MKKTLFTAYVESKKREGRVHRVGKCSFMNSRQYCQRVLWQVRDEHDVIQHEYVMLNGNAWNVRRAPRQPEWDMIHVYL